MNELMYSASTFYTIIKVFVFIAGTFVGSFLNVCIFRIPRRRSILYPPSHCFLCLTEIMWYHNLPVLGYFLLGGRCASCRQRFSIRYALIEFITGIVILSIFIRTSDLYSFLVLSLFMGAIIVLSFIDIDHFLLPDRITLPFIVIGILFSIPGFSIPSGGYVDIRASLLGLFFGFSILYLLGFIASFIMRKEALGGGDVKFMAMICSFLGWRAFLPVLLMAALQGSIFGLAQLIYSRFEKRRVILDNNGVYSVFKDRSDIFVPTSHHIPFGPFLGLSAYEYIIWGNSLIHYIFGLRF